MSTPQAGSGHNLSLSTASAADTMVDAPSTTSSKFSETTTAQSPLDTQSGMPKIIPPTHSNRTLVLCFDGTGDQFDADNSNVEQLFSMLKRDDRTKQMVYYQAGIGTYTAPQVATPGMTQLEKTLDMMIAWNIDAHVMAGYEFLMQNYDSGDRICIFGFSRGAYTARALAGMLHKVGLLPVCNHQQVPFAYHMYTRPDEIGWKQSNAFKRAFSIDVDIEFVGVWDTVNSVGLIPKRLPFTTSNTIVRTFRHAISLDERRAKFKANLWNRPDPNELKLGVSATTSAKPTEVLSPKFHLSHHHPSLRENERTYSSVRETQTDVDEVWFAGCHCDVGGGSVENATPHTLARIPLRWMIRECFKANSGIMFEAELLKTIGLHPASLYPAVLPRPPHLPVGSNKIQVITPATSQAANLDDYGVPLPVKGTEEEEELRDAMMPIYDQLSLAKWWWFLEFLPMKQRYQKSDNTWASYIGWNLGKSRFIPLQKKKGFRVHRSVKMRMEAEYEDVPGKKYKPRTEFLVEPTWVD